MNEEHLEHSQAKSASMLARVRTPSSPVWEREREEEERKRCRIWLFFIFKRNDGCLGTF